MSVPPVDMATNRIPAGHRPLPPGIKCICAKLHQHVNANGETSLWCCKWPDHNIEAEPLKPQPIERDFLSIACPDPFKGTVLEMDPYDLLKRAVRNVRPRDAGIHPRWVAVKEVFALGSTYARQLCLTCGVDPDQMLMR